MGAVGGGGGGGGGGSRGYVHSHNYVALQARGNTKSISHSSHKNNTGWSTSLGSPAILM